MLDLLLFKFPQCMVLYDFPQLVNKNHKRAHILLYWSLIHYSIGFLACVFVSYIYMQTASFTSPNWLVFQLEHHFVKLARPILPLYFICCAALINDYTNT